MKKFLVVVGVLVAIFAVLYAIGKHDEATRPPTPIEAAQRLYDARQDPQVAKLKFVAQRAKVRTYALENPDDTTPPETIVRQLQYFCDDMNSTVCIIAVWKNEADAAQGFPMSDHESDTLYLNYARNLNTGFEQLMLNDGHEVSIPSSLPVVRAP